MGKYVKLPVVIDAIRFTTSINELLEFVPDDLIYHTDEGFFIKTLEGDHHISSGDWIIRGIAGEYYPCKHDIFIKTYQEVV